MRSSRLFFIDDICLLYLSSFRGDEVRSAIKLFQVKSFNSATHSSISTALVSGCQHLCNITSGFGQSAAPELLGRSLSGFKIKILPSMFETLRS